MGMFDLNITNEMIPRCNLTPYSDVIKQGINYNQAVFLYLERQRPQSSTS